MCQLRANPGHPYPPSSHPCGAQLLTRGEEAWLPSISGKEASEALTTPVPWCQPAGPGPPCWGKTVQEMVKILPPFCIRLQRKRCLFFFFFSPKQEEEKKKKLRAAICRPWDVFLLDSPGPRLARWAFLRPERPQLGDWPAPSTRGLPAELGRQGGREAGRPGGSDAWHCPALWPRPLPAAPLPAPGLLRADRTACYPSSAHPTPTQGPLTFWAPASRPWVLLAPRAPGHVLGAAAARPTRLPALGGEPGTVPSCLGARPGLGNFPARVCVGGVRGAVVPGEGEAQMPGGRPHPPGLPLPPVS